MGNVISNPENEEESIKEYLKTAKEEFEKKWEIENKSEELVPFFRKDDFQFIKTVGTGSFGRVMVTHNDKDDSFCAVKCLSKDCIIEKEQLEHTYSEYKIMATIPPIDFLVNLMQFGQDTGYLYMVFEFVPGGELFSLLRSVGRIPEITATFYGAQVLSALHYLHNLDIIYRDLKPENILFSDKGYLKLTDFGFAKRCQSRTYTLCGTPEYLAPEIILCQGYHKAVDWWAFGILLFEMVCGHPPFYSENPMEIYKQEWLRQRHKLKMHQTRGKSSRERLLRGRPSLLRSDGSSLLDSSGESSRTSSEYSTSSRSFGPKQSSLSSKLCPEPSKMCHEPSTLSIYLKCEVEGEDECLIYPGEVTTTFKSLIGSLLEPDPTKRIGNLRRGVFEIKDHPFFARIKWDKIFRQRIRAPYIPALSGPSDTQNYRDFGDEGKGYNLAPSNYRDFGKSFDCFPDGVDEIRGI